MKTLIITIIIMFLTLSLTGYTETVVGNQDTLLRKYEKSDRTFIKLQIDDVVSYFHRRIIGEAIVEKDFIRYQFNMNTGQLLEKKITWREGLPDSIKPVITREQAESFVEGKVQFTQLYIISPESDIFHIRPTPENPCWVVRSIDREITRITVIDAVSGRKLGNGIPPPGAGCSFSGPFDSLYCEGCWVSWYTNAQSWFENMGYPTISGEYPLKPVIQSQLQNDSTAMFYEIGHSKHQTWGFQNWCFEYTTALEVEAWLDSYTHMPFAFLASCSGMCDTLDTWPESSLSYAFRKGSSEDAVTVGYCRMDTSLCADCWYSSLEWQDVLFSYMDSGYSIGYAFDHANLACPSCALEEWKCLRMAGDRDLVVVPPITRCLCRSVGECYCIEFLAEYYLVHCSFTVPSGQTMEIDQSDEWRFLNDSKIVANGTLNADGTMGQIRMVSAGDTGKGMEFTCRLRIMNGGQIKIYE